jgi:alanine racemase
MPLFAPSAAPGLLIVDLAAIVANWRALAERARPAATAAVVKANAYGLGLEEVAAALQSAGCEVFFVAHIDEGLRARAALGGSARIYVLNGLEPTADPDKDYAAHGLAPVIGSAEELERWAAAARRRGSIAPCALHLDTGMNRLGFASLRALKEAMAKHADASGADLLMSHFVASEVPGDPDNALQIARFDEARAAFRALPASLANSSGMFLRERPFYDLCRPGYALYGGNPTPGLPNPMRGALTLAIAIQQTRSIEAGETCGYNGQWTAKRRTRLATILAGYADGLPRTAGAIDGRPGADVFVAGKRCPLVGRVSMDTCIVDVTDVPESEGQPGDLAEFIGPQAGLDDFAGQCGAIGYHVLTSLGARYRRDYRR